ncbi:DUF6198 family protein [Collinsella tanakaei]|uniref:YczE/YyaS/YitT family protein n=1 Tax=Collinsella tanakaei TaxID=626935 RepID=UPI0025A4BE21|nr:DUF6198 family protein [Collinsella tanakaei]MDM8245354.1 DUF6198 family protein [Collinsella tanakaei]
MAYSRGHKRRLALRYLFFALGVAINSFGIAVITKAALGTSPISSVAYVLDLAFPPTLGEFTFVINLVFIGIQIALLRRDFQPVQFLQIVVNVVFSALIDVSMAALGTFEPTGLAAQLAALLIGCTILAFGIAVEVAPNVIVVPGEGAVRAISSVSAKPFGSCKVAFDVTLVAIALVLSLAFFRGIQGLGIGTVVSALLVGRIVNLFNRFVPFLAAIARLSRSEVGAPEAAA